MNAQLWTVDDLVRRWQLKPNWCYQHGPELPTCKLGSLVRYDVEVLKQFLLKSRRGPCRDSAVGILAGKLPEELITVSDVSQRWQVKMGWLYRHMPELPHFKFGNLVRFDPIELEQYLKDRSQLYR